MIDYNIKIDPFSEKYKPRYVYIDKVGFDPNIKLNFTEQAYKAVWDGSLKVNIFRHGNHKIIDEIAIKVGSVKGVLNMYFASSGSTVCTGANVIGKFDMRMWRKSSCFVGDSTTANGVKVVCDKSDVKIGSDCMFSDEILIQSNDQHGLVDMETGRIYNDKRRTLIIEDHVWLGRRSIVMPGVTVGSGSIVGTGAIVTKDIKNESIAVGIPAKIVKSNVSWSRQPNEIDQYISNELVNRNI